MVGMGGSGRQSLCRLAASISNFNVFQPEISKSYGMVEWREDLKTLLKSAGGQGKPTVFLLTDTQIKEESFLEDVDSLLNTGEVPNLFAVDEKAELIEVSPYYCHTYIFFSFQCLILIERSLKRLGSVLISMSKSELLLHREHTRVSNKGLKGHFSLSPI